MSFTFIYITFVVLSALIWLGKNCNFHARFCWTFVIHFGDWRFLCFVTVKIIDRFVNWANFKLHFWASFWKGEFFVSQCQMLNFEEETFLGGRNWNSVFVSWDPSRVSFFDRFIFKLCCNVYDSIILFNDFLVWKFETTVWTNNKNN